MGKSKQHSRNFRDEFQEFLALVKDEFENGSFIERDFNSEPEDADAYLNPEVATDLKRYFELAGLDHTAPGHWQFLLIAFVNFASLLQPGKPKRSDDEWDRFCRGMAELKLQDPDANLPTLCDRWWKQEHAADRHVPDRETLRTTNFYEGRIRLRKLVAQGEATEEQLRWLETLNSIKRPVGKGKKTCR